ncbi:MAG TPA: glycosyltransferase [Piscinibacter sp.]|nr:glycosyltransferase [Piscinibacter sp.]
MSLRVLIVTNLFADPFNASRATFNQQQFGRLAEQVDLTVMVPVSWLEVIRQPLAYRRLRRQTLERWPFADYVIYWYVPGVGRRFHAAFLFLSLLLQRLPTLLFRRWDCLFGSWGYPDAVAVAAVAKLTGVPMIAKVHGSDVNVFTREPARRAQICWALNHSRHVVAVSQALADRLAELGVDPARTTVLYNGVDPVRFHPVPRAQARRDLGFADDERVILYVGNILASKGCMDLMEAFGQLRERLPGLTLVYVGAGPLVRALTERAAAMGASDRVRFAGRLAHEEIVQWFGAADVFCLPSHAEGVPNVVLESMACGTPVVSTRVGGIPEVLPDFAGAMVQAQDTAALEAALFTALHTEWDRERIVEHARGFDWDKNVTRLRELIEHAAQRAQAPLTP